MGKLTRRRNKPHPPFGLRKIFQSAVKHAPKVLSAVRTGLKTARAIRKSHTRTRTTTGTFRHGVPQIPTLTGTRSSYKYGHKPDKWFKTRRAISAPYSFHDQKAFRIFATHGRQVVSEAEFLDFSDNELRAMAATIWNTHAIAQPAAPSLSNASLHQWKFLVEGVSKRYTIANAENVVVFATLYEYSTIKDTAFSPSNHWQQGLDMQYGTPSQGSIGALSQGTVTVGAKPNASQNFRGFFRIRNVTHIQLAPGQTHVHDIYGKPNHSFNPTILSETNNEWHRKLTHGTMLVAYGAPVHTAAETGEQPTIVTSGKVALDVIVTKNYYFRAAQYSAKLQMTRTQLSLDAQVMEVMVLEKGEEAVEDD